MSQVMEREQLSKAEILNREIEEMLAAENPFEGVYAMYGDHPDDAAVQAQQLARLTNINA